jgi:hypothetical protein
MNTKAVNAKDPTLGDNTNQKPLVTFAYHNMGNMVKQKVFPQKDEFVS